MNASRYESFTNDEKILRDQLAIDRTMLANDRTILSFARTALTLLLAGGSIIHFFEGTNWQTIGWAFLIGGALVFFIGFKRYRRINNELASVVKKMTGVDKEL